MKMKKSMVFLALLLCLQFRLLLASFPDPSSSSPGSDLESRSPRNIAVVVNRKGGGGGGHGGHGGGIGGAGSGRLIPFYGGNTGSKGNHHSSGSNRIMFASEINLIVATLLFTALFVINVYECC